jgi:hypothetical protein
MSLSRILLVLLRIAAGLQVVVGLTLWSGHYYSLVGVHTLVGIIFVILLWSIAGMAIARRRRIKLALFAILWGFVIVAVGMTQQRLLIGDLHWIVRVLHLIIGLSAMPIAERLARHDPSHP